MNGEKHAMTAAVVYSHHSRRVGAPIATSSKLSHEKDGTAAPESSVVNPPFFHVVE